MRLVRRRISGGVTVIVLLGVRRPLSAITWSPDGRFIAAAATGVRLQLWDVPAGRRIAPGRWVCPETSAVAFSPDSRTLAAGTGQWLWCFDAATGREVVEAVVTRRGHAVWALRFHPAGRLLIAVSGRGPRRRGALQWHDATGRLLPAKGFAGDGLGSVAAMEFTPGGRSLVTRGSGGLHLWEVRRRRCLLHQPRHAADSGPLAVSPDGRHAAFLERTGVRVVDFRKPEGGTSLTAEGRRRVQAVAFTPDGRWLVTAGPGEAVRFWDTASWRPGPEYAWGVGRLTCLAVAPDGLTAAAVTDKGQIVVWDLDLPTVKLP